MPLLRAISAACETVYLPSLARVFIPSAAWTWISSCAEAFGDADVLRVVFEYKRRLAEKFNALQTGDAADDGIRMTVRCHMLSVVCHFHIPLPTQPKWQLSCARNVKAGLDGMPSLKKQTGLLASCRSRPEWGTLV